MFVMPPLGTPPGTAERPRDMADLIESLRQAEKWLDRYEPQGRAIGEENTKAGLIEPILEGLGWDVRDPDEVHREYRRLSSDNPVDYALLLLRTPRLFVEAKGIGEHMDDPKWANQTIAYATAAGVEWVVLTNGAHWRIYNSHAPVPLEQKLFRSFKLLDDLDDAASQLQLLSKANMSDNRIEELWKAYFVDQQVHEALRDLFSGGEPAKALVAAVRHRTKNLTLKDVRTSLTRVRATFEFPAVGDSTMGKPAITKSPSTPAGPGGAGTTSERPSYHKVTPEEQKLSLFDLLARHLIAPGAKLEAARGGQTVSASLLADGSIDIAGVTYKTPSAAGGAAKELIAGHPLSASEKATDGWAFWQAVGPGGSPMTLKELRRQAAATG